MMSKGKRRKYIKMRNKGGEDVIEMEINCEGRSVLSYLGEHYIRSLRKRNREKQYIIYESIIKYINIVKKNKESITDILINGLYYNIKEVVEYVINMMRINRELDIIDKSRRIWGFSVYELAIKRGWYDVVKMIMEEIGEQEILRTLDNVEGIPINSIVKTVIDREVELAGV